MNNNSGNSVAKEDNFFDISEFSESKKVSNSAKGTVNINDNADQEIFGLYLPNYDSTGKETSVVRSKYTALFENRIYKIKNPIIEFKNVSEGKESLNPNQVIVTADEGIMNVNTSLGTLTGNVVINLDENTQVKTESLIYMPSKKHIFTNNKVVISSDKMEIKGSEFEIGLASSKATIKKNVYMELIGIERKTVFANNEGDDNQYSNNDLSKFFEEMESGHDQTKSYVKSKGELVFDLLTNVITFFDEVEAYIGELTIFADELRIILESEKRKVKEIIANGNVLAMDGVNIAKGDKLIWDSIAGVTTIDDKNAAEFLNDTAFVSSQKIRLYQSNGWAETPAKGRLITKSHLDLFDKNRKGNDKLDNAFKYDLDDVFNKKKEQTNREAYTEKYKISRNKFIANDEFDENNVNVTWSERMLFKNDEHMANFNGDVEIIRLGSKMNSDELTITFNNKNEIEGLKAKDNVSIIEQNKGRDTDIKADLLTWKLHDKPIEITGDPAAKIIITNKELSSAKIQIFENGDRIVTEEKGNITINPSAQTTSGNNKLGHINLEWQGNMIFRRQEGRASFYENIKAFKDGMNITCDVFDVYFDHEENLRRIVALENVYISSELHANTEAYGTMLTWNIEENVVELTGDPFAELRKDGSRTLSKKIFFDVATKRVTWEGGSQWQLMNKNK